jgi:hypothetical protein
MRVPLLMALMQLAPNPASTFHTRAHVFHDDGDVNSFNVDPRQAQFPQSAVSRRGPDDPDQRAAVAPATPSRTALAPVGADGRSHSREHRSSRATTPGSVAILALRRPFSLRVSAADAVNFSDRLPRDIVVSCVADHPALQDPRLVCEFASGCNALEMGCGPAQVFEVPLEEGDSLFSEGDGCEQHASVQGSVSRTLTAGGTAGADRGAGCREFCGSVRRRGPLKPADEGRSLFCGQLIPHERR